VPTPRGTISLRVPPDTSSGKKLRVKGHGIAGRNGETGDLFAEIQIVLPTPLDPESIDLIKKFDAHAQTAHPQNPRRDLRW
jgi:DnaJ-class molecular chaperone